MIVNKDKIILYGNIWNNQPSQEVPVWFRLKHAHLTPRQWILPYATGEKKTLLERATEEQLGCQSWRLTFSHEKNWWFTRTFCCAFFFFPYTMFVLCMLAAYNNHLTPSRTIDCIRDVSFCPKMVKQHANKWSIVNELPLVLIHHTSNLRFWIYP